MTTPSAWIHLTARLPPKAPDLTREDTGGWLWSHLRAAFPHAVAVALMPDHPHLIVPGAEPRASEQRLARLLGQFSRVFPTGGSARVASPEPIRTRAALARQIRYVALNPCRANLVPCPLAWPWSTHRDLLGACVDPWITPGRMARTLDTPLHGFVARHHAYVSGDPDVSPIGTTLPQPAVPTSISAVSLRRIAEAVAAATRTPFAALRQRGLPRALFVALAYEQGWDHVARLAQVCTCSTRTIRNLAASVDELALRSARLCLGDARLRTLPAPRDRDRRGALQAA